MHTIDRLRPYIDALRLARDLGTLKTLRRPDPGRQALAIRFRGQTLRVVIRGESCDVDLVKAILRENSEYRLPVAIVPSVIFDIGANIGVTALYFAAMYPNAHIYCFEPLPENLDLLRENTAPFGDRITVVPQALGDREDSLPYCYSDDPTNFGGGTFYGVGGDQSRVIYLPMTTVARACDELGVRRIDVMKIDTEGAELAVLNGIPDHLLRDIAVLVGELHGVDDFAFLGRLSSTHSVGFAKRFDARCFSFEAVRNR